MKKSFSPLLIVCSLVFIVACEKNETTQSKDCVPVKILDVVCNSAVLQITDPAYYHLGVNGYEKNGITYDHVFTTILPCKLPSNNNSRPNMGVADKPFYVQILDQPEASDPNCGSCAAIVSNAPNKLWYVSFSEKCN
ncbi:hypothetical protein [Sediminibacterium goheungense]|uniref:Lipoprotein n=1 Tax=Sediminibacterium goheungense TaxID=1086393 RepID=A0A4R6J063_9BACT|nr:hypothetical protein [Sediminibacterium goheungense]TDO28574.1 hypothetical protein BC659_0650 [Sediminibacterium goheungense]